MRMRMRTTQITITGTTIPIADRSRPGMFTLPAR